MQDAPHFSRSDSGKIQTLPTPSMTQGDFLSQNFGKKVRPICRQIRYVELEDISSGAQMNSKRRYKQTSWLNRSVKVFRSFAP